MSIPVSELTENDYKILEYVNRFDSVHKDQIKRHFDGKIDALDYRLSVLSHIDGKVSGGSYLPLSNSSYIEEEFEDEGDDHSNYESLNSFHKSNLGKRVLQDHAIFKREQKQKRIIAIATLILTVITAVASVIAAIAAIISALK